MLALNIFIEDEVYMRIYNKQKGVFDINEFKSVLENSKMSFFNRPGWKLVGEFITKYLLCVDEN